MRLDRWPDTRQVNFLKITSEGGILASFSWAGEITHEINLYLDL